MADVYKRQILLHLADLDSGLQIHEGIWIFCIDVGFQVVLTAVLHV